MKKKLILVIALMMTTLSLFAIPPSFLFYEGNSKSPSAYKHTWQVDCGCEACGARHLIQFYTNDDSTNRDRQARFAITHVEMMRGRSFFHTKTSCQTSISVYGTQRYDCKTGAVNIK